MAWERKEKLFVKTCPDRKERFFGAPNTIFARQYPEGMTEEEYREWQKALRGTGCEYESEEIEVD